MNKAGIIEKYKILVKNILEHNRLYYDLDNPKISDFEYDNLYRELKDYEDKYDFLDVLDSPSAKVGGSVLKKFKSILHEKKMLSLDNTYNEDEIASFYKRIKKLCNKEEVVLTIEPKIDGVAVSLMYEGGILKYAGTRGDGSMGDDITNNIKTIKSLPQRINFKGKIEFRAEAYMSFSEFKKYNHDLALKKQILFANPRNATSGSLKMLDSTKVAKRPISISIHSIGMAPKNIFREQSDFYNFINEQGLPSSGIFYKANNLEELFGLLEKIAKERISYDFPTDGAVIKVNYFNEQEVLGEGTKSPRWAIAYKFPPEQVQTKLYDITIQVGRSGILTPVAELETVNLDGSNISRASLHNASYIREKDIRIGDTVVIEKAGDIIPAVVKSLKNKNRGDVFDLSAHIENKCPSCSSQIIKNENIVRRARDDYTIETWFCKNGSCPAQLVEALVHFTSRKALDIEGIDTACAKKLIEKKLVVEILDIFSIDHAQLSNLELDSAILSDGRRSKERRFGEKRATLVLQSLKEARNLPLWRWIYGFGISEIGENTAKEITKFFSDFNTFHKSKYFEKIVELSNNENKMVNDKISASLLQKGMVVKNAKNTAFIYKIGPSACQKLINFFSSEYGNAIKNKLQQFNINPKSDNYFEDKSTLPLIEKKFVITGTLSKSRDFFKKEIEKNGGKVVATISKNTDFLLYGKSAGSKLTKAKKLNINLLEEDDFYKLIDTTS